MGLFGKFFGKKDEPEEFPSFAKPEFAGSERPEEQQPFQAEHWTQPYQFQQPLQQPIQAQNIIQPAVDKELQIISAKLDTLKAMLDDINNRLARLEKLAGEQTEETRWR